MSRHSTTRPRPPRLASLLALASTASALTLSSFQLITSSGTPIACLIVYNSILPGCSTRDFTSGNACSPGCVTGILDVQARVAEVCDGVDAPGSSVLRQAQQGNLIPLLCPSAPERPTPSSSTRPPVATAITLVSTIRLPSYTKRLSVSASSSLTTVVSLSETARSRPSPPPASDLPPPPTQQQPPQPAPTFVQSDGPAQQQPTTTTTSAPQPTRDSGGGGSPFDGVRIGAAGRAVEVGRWVYALVAVGGWLVAR